MKRLLLTLAAMLAVTSVAAAADMPVKAPASNYVTPTQVIWSGFYFGGQAGWASIDTDPSFGQSASGFTYGGHIGIMKQFGSFVAGIEGNLDDFSNVKTNGTGCDCIVADIVGKLGFTPTPNTLLYGLGGGFWHNANIIGVPQFGWVVGGGAAWKPFDNHWTVAVEYKYRDLDLKQTAPITVFSHAVQGKLSYQF